MKKIQFLLFPILLLALFNNKVSGQPTRINSTIKRISSDNNSSARISEITKYAQTNRIYTKNDTSSRWSFSGTNAFIYDFRGNVLQQNRLSPSGDTVWVRKNKFDENGYLLEFTMQVFEGGEKFNHSKKTISYDNYYNPTESKYYNWENNQWKLTSGQKHENTYDEFGRQLTGVTSEYDPSSKTWDLRIKDQYFYSGPNADDLSGYIAYEYIEDKWTKTTEFTDIKWKNIAEDEMYSYLLTEYDEEFPTSYRVASNYFENDDFVTITEIKVDEEWQNFSKESNITFSDSSIYLEEEYENGLRIPVSRSVEYFSEQGEVVEFKREIFEERSWTVQNTSIYKDIFEGDELRVAIREYNSNNYISRDSTIYLDYITLNILSTPTPEFTSPDINLFPNPAEEVIHLENHLQTSEITIYNSYGISVYNLNLSAATNSINISDLQKGIYFLEGISDTGQKFILRFVKE